MVKLLGVLVVVGVVVANEVFFLGGFSLKVEIDTLHGG